MTFPVFLKKRYVLYAVPVILILVSGWLALCWNNISFTNYVMVPDTPAGGNSGTDGFGYALPLDPHSPWPKFRNNALQNGHSRVIPEKSTLSPWTFATGKGIFSSPVVDKEGTVYIGSADHYFYAVDQNGKLKWKVLTGEIIDSSALLDNQGRVFVGSGDGQVYAFDRNTGKTLWTYKAHTPEEVTRLFGVKTYNLNWFEGNIAMLPDGSILAPNDNYLIYRLDRDSGKPMGQYLLNEMGWSLPAVNPITNKIITGSNFMALKNVYAFDADTYEASWTRGGFGTNAASVLLTNAHEHGAAIVGGFDGMVRAFGQKDGHRIWSFGTRDHIYASCAQLSNGTLIQPSTDGTVYALNPETGKVVWAYDTKEPIRSSPAVDGQDRIYFGSGQGRLYCLNPDGTFRWAWQLIADVRNDINASPALGRKGVYIAGESGGVFFVPYDYPLTEKGKADPHAVALAGEDLPDNGVFLIRTEPFGALESTQKKAIHANAPLCFSLVVRENGDTIKTAIDRDSLEIKVDGPDTAFRCDTAASGQFFTLIPREYWTGKEGGSLTFNIRGAWQRNFARVGLKFFRGSKGGQFDQNMTFDVLPRKGAGMPLKVPDGKGSPSSVVEISRLAPANPSILPSYNQIGYDSLHYILGVVEQNKDHTILWGIGGKLSAKEGTTVIDPDLEVRFPMMLAHDGDLVTLYNYDGILLDMNGSWDMPIELFRISTAIDPGTRTAKSHAAVNAVVACDQIEFYGHFLKLLGMSEFDTGRMTIFGGADYSLFNSGMTLGPGFSGRVNFSCSHDEVLVDISGNRLEKSAHVHSLLLVDERTNRPVPLPYIDNTRVATDAAGLVSQVRLSLGDSGFKGPVRAYYMVDTYPAAHAGLEVGVKKSD